MRRREKKQPLARRALSALLVMCMVFGLMPSYAILPARAAVPEEIRAELKARFVEMNGTGALTVTDQTGAPFEGATLSYESAREDVATIDDKGEITPVAIGQTEITVTADFSGVKKQATVKVPVVGANQLIINDVNHGAFEGDAYIPTITPSSEARNYLWRVNKGESGLYGRVQPEFVPDSENMETYLQSGAKILRMSLPAATAGETNTSRMLLEVAEGAKTTPKDPIGFLPISADKLYEYTGWVKSENVPAGKTLPITAEVYFYNSLTTAGTSLVAWQETNTKYKPWDGKTGSQDWTFFNTQPSILYQGDSAKIPKGANARVGHVENGSIGDLYLADLSFHEVQYETLAFQTEGKLDTLTVGTTLATTVQHYTNTGNEIKPGRTTSNAIVPIKVTYASKNEDIATIDENGAIRGVSAGKATITATAKICGVTREAELAITVKPAVVPKPDDLIYNFFKLEDGDNHGVKVETITDYAMTTCDGNDREINKYTGGDHLSDKTKKYSDPWKYLDVEKNAAGEPITKFYFASSAYGMMLDERELNGGGSVAFQIKVPADGKYQPVVRCGHWNSGAIVRVFIAPADAEDPKAEQYSVGSIDSFQATAQWLQRDKLRPLTLSAGDYIVTYDLIGSNRPAVSTVPQRRFATSALILLGVTDSPAVKLTAAPLSGEIVQNKSGETMLTATAADGSCEDLCGVTITATPQNAGICSVSVENGPMNIGKKLKIEGKAGGTTKVDIRASYGGKEIASTQLDVTIKGYTGVVNDVKASIDDAPSGRIARLTTHQIKAELTDTVGSMILPEDAKFSYSVEPKEIASVDEAGNITALQCGKATVSVRAEAKGGTAKVGTFELLVAEDGENLFAGSNPGFDTDDWLWDQARDTTGTWRTLSIDRAPNAEDADNRAMKVTLDPKLGAEAPSGMTYKGGKRIKIKTNRFYEMSFKVKIEDLVKPDGASGVIAITPDMYAWDQPSGGKLAGITYRNLEIHKIPDYENQFSDWARVSLEIAAPIDKQTAPGLDYIYAAPRFSITQSNSTMKGVTGYGGTIWFDDFELREVGFDRVELSRDGELTNIGDKAVYTVTPRVTTGNKIAIAAIAVPSAVQLETSDEMVATVSAARPTTAGSNVLPTIADVMLNGKNGTANITANVTLNGVTRSTQDTITVSGQAVTLYSAAVSLSKDEATVGETVQASASAMMTDGTAADLSNAVVLYYSDNEDVAEIDPVSGKITVVGEGQSNISVRVKQNDVVKTASTVLRVSDTSPLKSAYFNMSSTHVGVNGTLPLVLGGKLESGNPANFDAATVKYIIESGAENISIDEKGVVTGKTIGSATVKAEVTLRGVTVVTTPITLTVVKGAPISFGIDFTKDPQPEGDPKKLNTDAVYAKYGWMIDQEQTNATTFSGMRYQVYGIQFQSRVNQQLTFRFKAPQTGCYAFTMSGGNYDAGSSNASVYVDGVYIGSYNFHDVNNNVQVGPKVAMRPIVLTAGDHTLMFKPALGPSGGAHMYPGNLQFVGLLDMPEVTATHLDVENADLGVGETTKATATYEMDSVTYRFYPGDTANTVSYTSSNTEIFTVDAEGTITAQGLGKAELIAKLIINGEESEKRLTIEISNKKFEYVSAALASTPVYPGQSTSIVVTPKFDNGSDVKLSLCTLKFTTDTDEFISIDDTGKITAKKAGTTQVTVQVTFAGETKTAILDVTVVPTKLAGVIVSAERTFLKPGEEPVQITVSGRDNLGKLFDLTGATYRYSSGNEAVVRVSEDGIATPVGLGNATVTVDVTFAEQSLQGKIDFVITQDKTASTYYTEEKLEAAHENIQKYSWAQTLRDTAVKNAEKYVGKEEKLWNLVTQEGLPRGITVGFQNDPNAYTCAYCGCDIRAKYYAYGWISSPLENPWKVQCPDCRRWFPSNDFEGFYQLGIDENGTFRHDLAHERNAELVANGEDGYLKNILYPEKDVDGVVNWGVDDGFGYKTGVTFSNNVVESKTWIAYYIHYGLWYRSNPGGGPIYNQGVLSDALNTLRDAYLYTGDARYGRTGAILIDRVADVYPDFDLSPYYGKFYNSHGGGGEGKIIGRIWETGLAKNMVYAYDAFYPAMDDPYVINFLNQKAEKYNLPNKKESAKEIRENGANGILRTVFAAAKKAQILGNFGMHQSAVANAAIVHDTMPETAEWIDWVYQDGYYARGKCTGGNVNAQLVNLVNRDAMGDEAAPGYNIGWLTNTTQIAEAMYGYDKYPAADLYQHPKFKKMFTTFLDLTLVGRNTVAIGDSGSTADTGLIMSTVSTILGFQRLGDPLLAQATYQLNGNSFDGLHADIFTKDPEAVIDQMREIVRERGQLSFGSKYLGGEGFGILRAGEYRDAANKANIVDTQRDFWIRNGRTAGHGHPDALNLGIEAFGINMAPELGYPEATGSDPNRVQWINSSISHNTVTVDLKPDCNIAASGQTQHFDDSGRVKMMDLSHDAYVKKYSDGIYRRTLVMVDASDEVSYGIDFFRVKGGNDHLYSFHSQSDTVAEVTGLSLRDQKRAVDIDADGNPVYEWIGSYAGADVPWGVDTASNASSRYGTTWLEHIRKDKAPKGAFSVDYKIDDFREVLPYEMDLHLRVTMLNNDLSEVTLAKGTPPRVRGNPSKLEFLIARRKGTNLDTLFTTVYEPYRDERYIEQLEGIDNMSPDAAKVKLLQAHQDDPSVTSRTVIHAKSGTEGENDVARAVKVTLCGGRVDYVIYATNQQVMYTVTELNIADNNGAVTVTESDLFDYRGFVGVRTMMQGEEIYSYLNDGDTLGDMSGQAAVSGTVTGFTKELSSENEITIRPDTAIDPAKLNGKHIVVKNDAVESGTYEIRSASANADGSIKLDIGDVTLIRAYKNAGKDFTYNIAEGQSFRIPLATVRGSVPMFAPISDRVGEAGSEMKFQVSAASESGKPLTYRASDLPRGANFDENTQTFTWIPDSAQVGKHHATFHATDGALEGTQTVNITIHNRTNSGQTGPITGPSKPDPKPQPQPDTKPESSETKFTADPEQEVEVKNKLANVTFPKGSFDNKGAGVLVVEKNGDEITLRVTINGKDAALQQPARVSTAYTPSGAMKNPDCIIVRAPSGEILASSRFENGMISFIANKLGTFRVEYNEKNFADLGGHPWASTAILRLAARDIIRGTSKTEYSPGKNITRADFITLIVRALNLKATKSAGFTDVPDGAYYADAVAAAKEHGIAFGVTETEFDPFADISRQDMMVILARALDISGEQSALDAFDDAAELADYARSAAAAMVKNGYIAGSNGKLNPRGHATRAEVAVLLDRILF